MRTGGSESCFLLRHFMFFLLGIDLDNLFYCKVFCGM